MYYPVLPSSMVRIVDEERQNNCREEKIPYYSRENVRPNLIEGKLAARDAIQTNLNLKILDISHATTLSHPPNK
jgi:hypothetical protein